MSSGDGGNHPIYFHFSARDDDASIMAWYRIGPLGSGSVVVTHPDIVEAEVIAIPDPVRGEFMEAFVVLEPNCDGKAALELQIH